MIENDKSIDELVAFLTESVQQGKDFILEQAPEVAQEIVFQCRWESTFYCVIASVCVVVGLIGLQRLRKKGDPEDLFAMGNEVPLLAGFLLIWLVFAGSICLAMVIIPQTIKAWFCPKLIILDYLAQL